MSAHDVGPIRLLISELGTRREQIVGADTETHDAEIVPALAIGPHHTLLELSLRRWDGGGEVGLDSRLDSHPHFQRLVQGLRLGIRDGDDGTATSLLGLTVWDGAKAWASVKKAGTDDLDRVAGQDARALLIANGVLDLGTRAELWGDTSNRRNYLEVRFDLDDPLPALAAYTLTRLMPVLAAVEASAP